MSGVCDKLSKLTDLTLKGDYDLTLQLLDSPSDSEPGCSHHFKGSMKHNFLGLVALSGIMVGAVAMSAVAFNLCSSLLRKIR